MSGLIEGEARYQTTLFPEAIDEYIEDDNLVMQFFLTFGFSAASLEVSQNVE